MSLDVLGCPEPKAASGYWSFLQHKAEGGGLAEEQAFPHFLLQLKLVVTLELACLQSFLSAPVFIIIFNLCDHSTSSLGFSAAFCPSAWKVDRRAEQRIWPSLSHYPWGSRGADSWWCRLKVMMLMMNTLLFCFLVHLWSPKLVGWAVIL